MDKETGKLKLTPTQLRQLYNVIKTVDVSQYKSFALQVTEDGDFIMDRWKDKKVTVEKISSNPKVKVLSCLS